MFFKLSQQKDIVKEIKLIMGAYYVTQAYYSSEDKVHTPLGFNRIYGKHILNVYSHYLTLSHIF